MSSHGILTELVQDQPPEAATYCRPSQTSVPENATVLEIVPSYQFVPFA